MEHLRCRNANACHRKKAREAGGGVGQGTGPGLRALGLCYQLLRHTVSFFCTSAVSLVKWGMYLGLALVDGKCHRLTPSLTKMVPTVAEFELIWGLFLL